MVIENICPVCGYAMDDPPKDFNICPSCGTEFGNHDVNASLAELRVAWLLSGPKWWSLTDPQPPNWDPFEQLINKIQPASAQSSDTAYHFAGQKFTYQSHGRRTPKRRPLRRSVPGNPVQVYEVPGRIPGLQRQG